MGTSKSSTGPGSGVPLVPSWVEEPDETESPDQEESDSPDTEVETDDSTESVPDENNDNPELAEPDRFRATRVNLSSYGREGDLGKLKRGLGHYASKGLGGASNAGARMGKTSQTAQRLVQTLETLRSGETVELNDKTLDSNSLEGKSAREAGDSIIEVIRPTDGTQDAEANRQSLNSALAELAEEYDDTLDLSQLNDEQIEFLIERYVGHDICQRIELDVGQSILSKAGISEGYKRLAEMTAFVHEKVRTVFSKEREKGVQFTAKNTQALVHSIIVSTFEIFEDYLS